jgi:importin-9
MVLHSSFYIILFLHTGYGVYLAEIVVTQSAELPVRQLASVMLKQYVEEHWCQDADGEEDCSKLIVNEQAKKTIKSMLPEALYDPNSKLRNTVAYTISTIASSDWPSDWSELFDIIVKCLGGNDDSIHGAMQVLIEFTMDLNSQISTVSPLILSEVYRIFEADNVYSVRTRTSTVEILNSLLKSINMHVESKQERANLLNPILGSFVQKLIIGLTVPNGQFSDFALKTEIIKVFTYMINEMPKFISTYIDEILPPMWQLLTAMADIYIKTVVNNQETSQFSNDADDERLFIKMILQTFEFVHSIIESKKFKPKIAPVLTDLVYIIIIYMQMTEEQMENWMDDVEKFVEDEDEEGVDFSVRTSVQDVLLMVGKEYENTVLCSLNEALTKHCAVAEASRGSQNWWKIHESSMLAVGSLKLLIINNCDKFDVSQYLNLVKNFIDYNSSPFLLGRILWLFSSYAESESIYNLQILEQVLNTTITCLMPDKPCVLKISSARAVFNFCTNLKESQSERRELVKSKLDTFFDGMMSMMSQSQNAVLGLLMETISAIIQFDEHFTGTIANKVISLTIAVFLKHDDRFILELVQENLKTLSQNQYCLAPLQEKIVPTLVSILNLQDKQPLNSSLPDAMQDIALDILQTILRYSKAPLSSNLIDVAFPAAINCILRTDDHSIMQSGGECLRAFLTASPQQVCEYKNGEGLNYVLQVATMLLNPRNTEFSASFVGRLIVTIITKAGIYLGESIDLLLKAVISKMQLVESLSVIMSLCMIFAHLIIIQMDAVINFLCTVPGPTGKY